MSSSIVNRSRMPSSNQRLAQAPALQQQNIVQQSMPSSNQQLSPAPVPQRQSIVHPSMPDEDATPSPSPSPQINRAASRQRRGDDNRDDSRIRQRGPSRGDIEDDDRSRQKRVAYYKSPDICCCDLQSGLVTMSVIDIIIGFIFFIVALSRYIGPAKGSSGSTGGAEPTHEDHPHGHGHFYHHHRPVWRFRRMVENVTTLVTTAASLTTTAVPTEGKNSGKSFFALAFMAALLITIASIVLLSAALMRKRTLCWVSCMIGSLIFLAASVLYCIYVFGNSDAGDSWPFLAGLVIALAYRIYESFVVFYFIKEPDPPIVRYDPGREVAYDNSPAVIYEPAYYGGYGYARPYYGGPYYGYNAGLGVTAGVGLGLALGGGFHDHYDYCDGGFGYDCY